MSTRVRPLSAASRCGDRRARARPRSGRPRCSPRPRCARPSGCAGPRRHGHPHQNVCFSDTLQVTGVLGPRTEVLVRPDREGLQITQVQVEPGDTVVAGQILARLGAARRAGHGARAFRCARRPPAPWCRPARWSARWRPGAGSRCSASPCRARWNCWRKRRSATLASLAPNQAAAVEIVGVGSLPGRVRLISTTINPGHPARPGARVHRQRSAAARRRLRPRPDRHRAALRHGGAAVGGAVRCGRAGGAGGSRRPDRIAARQRRPDGGRPGRNPRRLVRRRHGGGARRRVPARGRPRARRWWRTSLPISRSS